MPPGAGRERLELPSKAWFDYSELVKHIGDVRRVGAEVDRQISCL
jgi:hypothetical protein